MATWIVKGKFDRHQRKFEVKSPTFAQAQYEAESYIRAVLSQGSGAYSRLVWQQGEITMKNTENGEVGKVFDLTPTIQGL